MGGERQRGFAVLETGPTANFKACIDLDLNMDKSIPAALLARLRSHIPDLADLPEKVWKRTGALNTWGTNAIEGNTLTLAEVDAVLLEEKMLAGLPVPDVRETIQHEEAFQGILARRKTSIGMVAALELHEQVFRGFPRKRPGQWRTSNVYIQGTGFRPPRRERVIAAMEEWETELERRTQPARKDPWAAAAWMHHRFEQIHPFEDGNGRAGRLLLNLFLVKLGWPPVHILPPDRATYLEALEAGNGGHLGPFEGFLRVAASRGLLDLLDQVGSSEDELVDLAVVAERIGAPYKSDYLALRCRQGVIPAIRAGERSGPVAPKRGRPRWFTSEAGLKLGLSMGRMQD